MIRKAIYNDADKIHEFLKFLFKEYDWENTIQTLLMVCANSRNNKI
jgi:hypothetical protein